ncbi:PAS domain S-box protein [Allocoleopsis franciscana]|uniref:histidine kinase n=1 Tax=Allocoleopsis franciscana PCC 7113 TaxID=1173027 RepID=K9W8K6_9CYAN|nr:PAS domain S-box protein [Allocoleopsis franciscana]AFZ16553.1 histidine kinase,PAS domain-containing protein,PAS domain-containing protein,histidine kinase [Allocoleopsis franciscana PCC 7113]
MLPLQLDPQRIALTHWDNTLSEALFQDLPLGILVMEAQGEIRFVNQAALNLLGLSESQLFGQTPVDPDWHIIQENGKPFQLKLQSVPVRAKHTLMLLVSRQPLRNLVLGVYRPLLRDRVWLSINTEPKLGLDGCVERVICTLSDITNLKAEEKLSRLHECFLSLESDPDENINRLTALAGELLGGTWAVYNRLNQGLLWSLGQWQTPANYMHVGEPKHNICHEVIQRGSNQVFVLQDLQNTSYAHNNPDILTHQLQTYIGQAVKCAGEYIGALSVVYQNPFIPSQGEKTLMGIIAAAIGVEEEHKREATVWAQNEAKWRSLIQTSSNLITILEANGTIKYASPAIRGVLGYKPKELMGQSLFELVHPEDLVNIEQNFQGFLQNPTTDLSLEFRFRHQDGSWRYIESTYSNLLMDSPVTRIVVNFRDVTERKRAEEAIKQSEAQLREKATQLENTLHELQETQTQLIQTEKMSSLGLLVAGIAHEINNPVSFIYGNIPHATQYTQDLLHLIELYRQQYPHPAPIIQAEEESIDLDFLSEDLPKLMNSMQMGAERIRQIVLSLRNFSRLDKAAREPVDVHQGIDNTLLLLQHRVKAKAGRPKIEIVKEYGELPLVECYAGQMNQVFMNILGNAIDALEELNVERSQVEGLSHDVQSNQEQPPTPCIRIRTQLKDDNTVLIRIADNGPGMTAQVQQQIFDPFFTTKSVGQGTGLGLSISYQIIVDKHGGQLKCASTPGEGTEFWIELPVMLPHEPLKDAKAL